MTPSDPARRYRNLTTYRGVLMVAGVWLHTTLAYFDPPLPTGGSEVVDDEVAARCAHLSARRDLPWSPEQAARLQEVVPAVTKRSV